MDGMGCPNVVRPKLAATSLTCSWSTASAIGASCSLSFCEIGYLRPEMFGRGDFIFDGCVSIDAIERIFGLIDLLCQAEDNR